MAKQSGLHQIKGKVGEFSYYKQSGVSGGLIRSINAGMSARVKNGEEYANTRLNNVEFGGACNVAGLLGRMVVPKYRPMILPFSQSEMAKKVLDLARTSSENWGERVVPAGSSAELADILNAQSKKNPFDFVETLKVEKGTGNDYTASVEFTADQATTMASLGISALDVKVSYFTLGTGKYSTVSLKVMPGILQNPASAFVLEEATVEAGVSHEGSEDATIPTPSLPAQIWNPQQIAVFTILPKRMVSGTAYILQEYCSFYAVALPTA